MEIGRWLYYAVSCAILCYITAKPFSLNKFIESESNRKEVIQRTLSPKIEETEPAPELFSFSKGLKLLSLIPKKFKETGTKLNLIPLGKKISPLQYRKTFQIKSPLKPRRVKNSLTTRHKRKNQSIKREIDENAILNKKYVPLLRSLGMLFDNILGTDSGESYEKTKRKKRPRYYFDDDNIPCKCTRQREPKSEPAPEETVTFSETLAPETAVTTEVATETTDNPSTGNFRNFRLHTNVPLLLSRNTTGARRNHHGISERGRATYYGSAERYLSGNNRDNEYDSKHGQEQSNAESDEDYTNSDSRNDASSAQSRGAVRRREHRNNTEEVYENDPTSQDDAKNFLESREAATQHNGSYKFKIERDKAKSGKLLSEPIRKQQGFLSIDKVVDFAKSVQSQENYKESVVSISDFSSGSERLTNGNGTHSAENKKVNTRTETLTHNVYDAIKRFSAESSNEIKDKITDYPALKQNYGYDETNDNISYDDSELRHTDTFVSSAEFESVDSNSIEDSKTATISETMPHDEPVVQKSHDVSKKTKDNEIIKSTEIVQNEHKEKDGSMEPGRTNDSDQLDEDSKFSAGKEVNEKFYTTDKIGITHEIKNSQFLKPKSKGPVVMIIDGYSVTRHKNGENKLSGKAIRIRP